MIEADRVTATAATREDEDFARSVLRTDDESLATFWNREYFQGVMPPLVLQSPAAVRAYVAATPGAIGTSGTISRSLDS